MPGGCGCGGGGGQQAATIPAPDDIEYVVLLGDGTYTEAFPSLEAAFEHAYAVGGQARSRAKITH